MIVRHWFKCHPCDVGWSTLGAPSNTTDDCWVCGIKRTEFAWTNTDSATNHVFLGDTL